MKGIGRYIITGTPGSGKTSVVQMLGRLGYVTVAEAATDVIVCAQQKGILRPWEQLNFLDTVVLEQKARQESTHGLLQFYDRSPFCTYTLGCYLSGMGWYDFHPSVILAEELQRCLREQLYATTVFFFENLGFVEPTDVRKISYDDALVFEDIHLKVYTKFGFQLVHVPNCSIENRCRIVLEAVGG